ncbi:hypothetical protein SZN_32596 [Streptomyces zinciresistens K42]|uniref:Uncharacterized protein n=1 Tax=Streptomyces zinciresistens K42 TaxID=700597 RepID=G2GLW7_9ACTN|nr:Rv3235 family protein [Streptomyces zinciresistens]EGX55504.1 hypothetical protein SZN_32596 [Streptomyces zinciresistens K42]
MNKVMTRTQGRPGTRPAGRRDTRRPAGAPPRTPASGGSRTTSPGDRPPGPGASSAPGASTRPADNRPATLPARPPRTPAPGSTRTPAPGSTRTPAPGSTRAPAPGSAAEALTAAHRDAARTPALPRPSEAAPLPRPRPTDVFADRLLLVLSGQRPVHSMLRHTVGRAYDDLAVLAERGTLRTRGTRPVVRDLGWFEPRPGAVEVFARIGAGDQLRAMAFRLEQGGDLRWRCTAVELGGPREPRRDGD